MPVLVWGKIGRSRSSTPSCKGRTGPRRQFSSPIGTISGASTITSRRPFSTQYGLGPRVPLLIISPYAKSGYISHTQYEFSSVLRLIEERYSLQSLSTRDAGASDMLDSFDFSQKPQPPFVLQTRSCPVMSPRNLFCGRQPRGTHSSPRAVTFANLGTTGIKISSLQNLR